VLDTDREAGSERRQALARLAVLQRLRDQVRSNERSAMLQAIDHLIEAEARSLRQTGEEEEHPRA
jgi:hypothetical protein